MSDDRKTADEIHAYFSASIQVTKDLLDDWLVEMHTVDELEHKLDEAIIEALESDELEHKLDEAIIEALESIAVGIGLSLSRCHEEIKTRLAHVSDIRGILSRDMKEDPDVS